jgi:O-antigen/teichoic acid export membrane protein
MSILSRARPLMVSRLASAGLTFFIPLVLARALTPEEYGTYKQSWLVASTLYFVLQLGLAQSLYYFLPREPQRRASYLTQASLCLAALGAAAAAILAALGPHLGRYFGNPELPPLAPWIALTTFFLVAGAPYDVALTASGRVGLSGVVRVLVDLARTVGLLVPAWWLHSLRGLMLGLTWSSALRLAITWLVTLRAGRPAVSRADLRKQLEYALPFGAAVALAIPQQQFHQYAVGAMATTAAFAVYSVGCFQLPVVDLLYAPVSDILQVGIAQVDGQGRSEDAAGLFREAVAQLAFAFVPLVVFALASAPELMPLLFTSRYSGATPIFRVGVMVVPLSALPVEGVLRARAQRRFFLWTYAVKLAITVPLVLGLLHLLGPIGAMTGFVAAEAAAKAMMLSRVARIFRIPMKRALPLSELRVYAVAALAAVLPAWLLAARWRNGPGGLLGAMLASGAAFSAVYLLLLAMAGRLPALGFLRVGRARAPAGARIEPPTERAVARR